MDSQQLRTMLEDSPVIAAVKSMEGLEKCLSCDSKVVFVLFGDLIHVGSVVARIKDAGKAAFVHVDLIDGLSPREIAVDFVASNTRADGIISTKPALVRHARAVGLLAVQRFFLLDSIALQNAQKQLEADSADFIEVLPGVMPKIIGKIVAGARKPLIAGGLISDKEDILTALSAGALAISSTNEKVWFM